MGAAHTDANEIGAHLYLDLLKRCLTRTGFAEIRPVLTSASSGGARGVLAKLAVTTLDRFDLTLVRRVAADDRAEGRDVPHDAETMIGLSRLDNLERCITDVIHQDVPGDLIETGVWRGGAAIFMRAILKAYNVSNRTVWCADSFEGLPAPDPEQFPADAGDPHFQFANLAVSLETVKANFTRYGLLDGQVRFLPGWFRDTLPSAPIDQLSVLRLDGDMYESTMVALRSLYPRLSVGGYVIIDDFGAVEGCRAAVRDYREEYRIRESWQEVDWTAVYWRKEA